MGRYNGFVIKLLDKQRAIDWPLMTYLRMQRKDQIVTFEDIEKRFQDLRNCKEGFLLFTAPFSYDVKMAKKTFK